MKKVLNKIRILSIAFLSIMLVAAVIGCSDNADEPQSTGTTLQSQIDNATAGSTVTLNASYSGTSIVINKALTVNGNNISGLNVTVYSNVAANVTLRNFTNATVSITTGNSSRSALARQYTEAQGDDDEHFEKIGEDSPKLKLEGCSIEKLEAETDVALYVDNGTAKSEIDEIKLKDGAEDFTFVEYDKADKPETTGNEATPTTSKTKVGKLSIESDEIETINLIGGTFDDVDIADDFSGDPIDFKYDKEFEDQFGDDFDKDAFFGNGGNGDKIVEKDIGVVEKTTTQTDNGVYCFTMTKSNFNNFCVPSQDGNGRFAIVFMTDAQKNAITASTASSLNPWPNVATFANPIYAAIPAGFFAVDDLNTNGFKTIYGTEYAYVDYAAAYARGDDRYRLQDVVVLEKYRNYNKEAFIAEVGSSTVTIYVNMPAIKKSDVLLCAYWEPEAEDSDETTKGGEAGTKMTEISLDGYKPYLVINTTDKGDEINNTFNSTALHQGSNIMTNMIPYGNAIKLTADYNVLYIPMDESDTYPPVTNVIYTIKDTPYTPGTLHPLQNQDFD
ncbi:MAG: hypothetical protein J5647_00645 [Spirochaetaceae bacterium]|nr:hypothetical protein [Spirochaetaceae bacterium]